VGARVDLVIIAFFFPVSRFPLFEKLKRFSVASFGTTDSRVRFIRAPYAAFSALSFRVLYSRVHWWLLSCSHVKIPLRR